MLATVPRLAELEPLLPQLHQRLLRQQGGGNGEGGLNTTSADTTGRGIEKATRLGGEWDALLASAASVAYISIGPEAGFGGK